MNTLNVNLENCYGIKKLKTDLEFKDNKSVVIYAPNGYMKTSFANTFKDLRNGNQPKDRIFTELTTTCDIKFNGTTIRPENILVIEPFDESISLESSSKLIVNAKLKKEYDKSIKEIEDKKSLILKQLESPSGLKGKNQNPEMEIKKIFSLKEGDEYHFLKEFTSNYTFDDKLLKYKYSELFNPETIKLLESGKITKELDSYISNFEEITSKNPIFTTKFTHIEAENNCKLLGTSGFFEAEHKVSLHENGKYTVVDNQKDLIKKINEAKEKVLNDPKLVTAFSEVEKKLSNKALRQFRNYLTNNKEIIPSLKDYKELQKNLFINYLYSIKTELDSFSNLLDTNQKTIDDIVNQAKAEKTQWQNVLDIFKRRFSVPFTVEIENKENVLLKSDEPNIVFKFERASHQPKIDKSELISILSRGEQRALHILNILFDIEVKKSESVETVVIIDDIADSFDYKNKYAIVEYIKDIQSEGLFNPIILSHNFDFYRTITKRLDVHGSNWKMALKTDDELFIQDNNRRLPFEFFKKNLYRYQSCMIAFIPFARNLIEYTKGNDNTEFRKLTSLLHLKSDSNTISISDLEAIFTSIVESIPNLPIKDPSLKVIDTIFAVCDDLVKGCEDDIKLEDKITLSIGVRLLAEKYMIQEIADPQFVESINSYQTAKLYDKFLELGKGDSESRNHLTQVNLMTPENIHINAFMYEPILDMSAHHLYELYRDIKKLLANP